VIGSFTDPNAFSVYQAMLVPVAATLSYSAPVLGVLVGGAISPLSRTGLAALLVAMTLTVFHSGLRRYIWILIFAAVAAVVLARGFSSNAAAKRVSSYEGTLSERQGLWSLAVEVASEHPLFGIGRGNWGEVSGSSVIPHNTFLSILTDIGVFGFAVFMVPVLFWLWHGLRQQETRGWAITCLVGMVGGLAVSFDNFRFFWLAIGVLAAQVAAQGRGRQPLSPAWSFEASAREATAGGAAGSGGEP
jgi:O-antigen ligase